MNDNIISSPGQFPEILSHILAHLPFNQLKLVRLVSSKFNQEATKVLKKRKEWTIKFEIKNDADPLELFRFAREMKQSHIQFPTLSLSLQHGYYLNHANYKQENCTKKLIHDRLAVDLNWFLSPANNNHSFSKLNLDGGFFGQEMFDIKVKILTLLKDNLKELEWGGFWFMNEINTVALTETCKSLELLRFPKLKSFTFSIFSADHQTFSWLHFLVVAIQKVDWINIVCRDECKMSLHFLCHLQESKPLFVNLKRVSINVSGYGAEILEFATTTTLPIHKLVVQYQNKLQDIEILETFLDNFKDILQHLNIDLPPTSEAWSLRLPVLSKLKTLKLKFGFSAHKEVMKCNIDFGGILYYAVQFPLLQSLDVHCSIYNPILSTFFPFQSHPEYNEKCITVTRLDHPHFNEMKQGLISPAIQQLAIMFPHVHNKLMNSARNDYL